MHLGNIMLEIKDKKIIDLYIIDYGLTEELDYFNTINIITTELYNSYKNNELIKKLIAKVKTTESNYNNNNENDDFIIFQLCFSYSYFYITHKVLCSLINTNNTNNTNNNYQELLKIINRIK